MKFCIIGAGSGGIAFAVYLSSLGHSIHLYNRSFSRIYEIIRKGGIEAEGELNGFFPLDYITQDLSLAINDADIIMIVIPAFAHATIAEQIAPYLENDQIIVLNPGRTFGAIEVFKKIKEKRGSISVYVGETQTLMFTARQEHTNKVNILKIKNSVNFATYPDRYIDYVDKRIKECFPHFNPIQNYLEVTLNNIGCILHPTLSIFNASAMEFGKKFKFYKEGATPKVCNVLENIEVELNKIFKNLEIKQFHFIDWAQKSYGVKANSIYETIQKIEAYKEIFAPDELITRYFIEDVPTGLVPISSLAKYLNVQTPTIDSVIHLSSILCGCNFLKKGRTVQRLKLSQYLNNQLKNQNLSETVRFKRNSKVLDE